VSGQVAEKYIITAAQASYWPKTDRNGDIQAIQRGPVAKLHQELWGGLETYAARNDAEIIVLPLPGKDLRETMYHDSVLAVTNPAEQGPRKLNRNIAISDMKVPPQNIDPTTGRMRFAQHDRTLVFPHTKQRFKAIPSSNSELPKLLITTGAITTPNYHETNSRGDVARRDHIYGAVMVEVIDDVYYNVRHLRAQKNGKFVDLGEVYHGARAPKRARTDSLVLGDLHIGDTDPKAYHAAIEQIAYLKPRNVFLHDVFNGHSINPHEKRKMMRRAGEWKKGRMSLEEELKDVSKVLKELGRAAGRSNVYVVRSNHDEFLDRYLDSGDWVKEPWNTEIALELGAAQARGENTLEYGVQRMGGIPKNIRFLELTDDVKHWGYQLASHGHKGNSGARYASANSRETAHGGKSITGHSHTPEVLRDTYVVGTMTDLVLPYTEGGASSWMHANAALYDGGLVQMLPVINGKWKAEGKWAKKGKRRVEKGHQKRKKK